MMFLMFLAFLAGIALATQAILNSHLSNIIKSIISSLCCFFKQQYYDKFTNSSIRQKTTIFRNNKICSNIFMVQMRFTQCFCLGTLLLPYPKNWSITIGIFIIGGTINICSYCRTLWIFNFPITTIDTRKIIGVASMLLAIFLINKG